MKMKKINLKDIKEALISGKDKKIFLSSFLALLLALAVVAGVLVLRKSEDIPDVGETERPPVLITSPESSDGTDSEKLPYEGETYTLLVPQKDSLFLGDSESGEEIDLAAYERNVKLCSEMKISMSFRYSLSLYDSVLNSHKIGIGDTDAIVMNVRSDASRFMMSGIIHELLTPIAESSELHANAKYKMGRSSYLLIGSGTPSYVIAERMLRVKKASSAYDSLLKLSKGEDYTLENVIRLLSESGETMSLDGPSILTLASGGRLFSLTDGGEADVYTEDLVNGLGKLLEFKTDIKEPSGDSSAYVGTPIRNDGYASLPLPSCTGESTVSYDSSLLYAMAIPKDTAILDKALDITELLFELSEDIVFRICREYGIEYKEAGETDLYDIFGWGDFERHVYSAWEAGSISTLGDKLSSPEKAALTALRILYERCIL